MANLQRSSNSTVAPLGSREVHGCWKWRRDIPLVSPMLSHFLNNTQPPLHTHTQPSTVRQGGSAPSPCVTRELELFNLPIYRAGRMLIVFTAGYLLYVHICPAARPHLSHITFTLICISGFFSRWQASYKLKNCLGGNHLG